MINAITPDTLYLILPYKVSLLAARYAQEHGGTAREAVERIYRSKTYERLACEDTKLWHLGPVALYDYFTEHQ